MIHLSRFSQQIPILEEPLLGLRRDLFPVSAVAKIESTVRDEIGKDNLVRFGH